MPVKAFMFVGRQPFFVRLKNHVFSKSRGKSLGTQDTTGCFAVFAYFGQKIGKSSAEQKTAPERKRPLISRPLTRDEIYYVALITEGLVIDNYTVVEYTELNDNIAVIVLSNERPVINICRGFKSNEITDAFPDVKFEYGPNRVWNGIERVLTYETEYDGGTIRGFPASSWLEIAESVLNIAINCNRFGRKKKSNYTNRRCLRSSPDLDRTWMTGDSHTMDGPWVHQYQMVDRPDERMRMMVMHFHEFVLRRPQQPAPLPLFVPPALLAANEMVSDHRIRAQLNPRLPVMNEEQRAEYHRQLMQGRADHRRRPILMRSNRRLQNVPYNWRHLLQPDALPLEDPRPPSRMANVFH